jgi:hypothetical protein
MTNDHVQKEKLSEIVHTHANADERQHASLHCRSFFSLGRRAHVVFGPVCMVVKKNAPPLLISLGLLMFTPPWVEHSSTAIHFGLSWLLFGYTPTTAHLYSARHGAHFRGRAVRRPAQAIYLFPL